MFIIDKNRIGKGVTHFTFFNEENKPVCERLVYVKPPVTVGPTISSDKQVYDRRQPLDLTIDGFELNPKLTVIDYNGLQLQIKFYSPEYITKEQIEKKYLTTLFWDASIQTGAEKHPPFFSSDMPGKYIVIVQRMNKNGDFVVGSAVFEVK